MGAIKIDLKCTDRDTLLLRDWADPDTGRTWHLDICPMLYNHRLVMVPADAEWSWDFGWCFRSGPSAAIAGAAWDPLTEDEPLGWHKRAGTFVRQAPRRRPDDPLRCDHGAWQGACIHVGCRWHA